MAGVGVDDSGGEKVRVLNLFPGILHEDHSSSVSVHIHQEDHQQDDSCGISEKRSLLLQNLFPTLHECSSSVHHPQDKKEYYCSEKRLLNLFPIHEDSSSFSDVHASVRKSAFSLWPKVQSCLTSTLKENSSVDINVHAPLTLSSSYSQQPPKKRLRREEEEEDDSSAYDIIHAPNTKSAFSLWPKQRLTTLKDHISSVDNNNIIHAPPVPPATNLPIKLSLSSKQHSSVDPVTRCLGNWQIKKRRTSASSSRKTQCFETDDHNKIRNLPATDEDHLKRFITGEEINGTDIRLVIQKKLFKSDLKRDLNRLSMPIKKLETNDFLTPEEKVFLNAKENVIPGIEVGLVGPKLEMYEKPMRLKLWTMRNNKNYVLITNWSDFVDDNKEHLKKDRVIRVWSFRKDEQLCFAISIM